jgi:DNA-binding SARP family transcriptional activator
MRAKPVNDPPRADPHSDDRPAVVRLLGDPVVSIGNERRAVPEGSKRLLAYVALYRGRVERPRAAGTLWPSGDEGRAAGNLRSALWRLRGAGIDVVVADKWSMHLLEGVVVDVVEMFQWADRLIQERPERSDLTLSPHLVDALNLLPGWYDDWAITERERLRQRMLHGLEALSHALSVAGRHADAIEVALRCIEADPLRESAHRVLVEAHLNEGNWIEARRAFASLRCIMLRELGVEPSRSFAALLTCGHPRRAINGARELSNMHRRTVLVTS